MFCGHHTLYFSDADICKIYWLTLVKFNFQKVSLFGTIDNLVKWRLARMILLQCSLLKREKGITTATKKLYERK